MKLIFISGLPGVGKLTVAKELSALTGFRLFHNHLTVDLLLSVFDFGAPPFIELREKIWLSVFHEAGSAGVPGLIFTFNAENSVRQSFIENTIQTINAAGGSVAFIELVCSDAELERRMGAPSRHAFTKMTSWQQFLSLRAAGVFDKPVLPAPHLRLDVENFPPAEAARKMAQACGL